MSGEDVCCEVNHSEHEIFEAQTGLWDQWGLFLSGLCAIHCLVTPLLVLFLPVMGNIFESAWAHVVLAIFVVPIGLFAFWSGYRHHRQLKVFALGCSGLAFIAIGSVVPHSWVEFREIDIVTVTGSVFLIIAHILNRRACLCHKHA